MAISSVFWLVSVGFLGYCAPWAGGSRSWEACQHLCGGEEWTRAESSIPVDYNVDRSRASVSSIHGWRAEGGSDDDDVGGRFFFPSHTTGTKITTGTDKTVEKSGKWYSGFNFTTLSTKVKDIDHKEEYTEDKTFTFPWGRKKRSVSSF